MIGVRVGDHDISKERDCDVDRSGFEVQCAERYQDFGVESIHYHPQYTRRKLQNDIALIKLNGTIDFRPYNVKPICLPLGTAARQTSRTVRIYVHIYNIDYYNYIVGTLQYCNLQYNVAETLHGHKFASL